MKHFELSVRVERRLMFEFAGEVVASDLGCDFYAAAGEDGNASSPELASPAPSLLL